MPFKSEAQRRYMFSEHPRIAERWMRVYGKQGKLPERLGRKSTKMSKPHSKSHGRKS